MPAPRAESEPTALRLLSLLRKIPRQPNCAKASDLHRSLQNEGYPVSIRTVQRDLAFLSSKFPITTDHQAGREGAIWFWMEDAEALNIPGMDPAVALALLLAEKHLQNLLPGAATADLKPYFSAAERTLARLPGRFLAAWRNKVRVLNSGPALAIPQIEPAVQRAVYEGLLTHRQLKVLYKARGAAEAREQVLHPLAVVVKDGVVYLVATTWNYVDPRQYALQRFKIVEVLPDRAMVPEDFSIDDYIAERNAFSYPVAPDSIRIILEVGSDVAIHLDERPLAPDQTVKPGRTGRALVEATVGDTQELRWWLLGFGDRLEVMSPRRLRNEVSELLAAAASLYKKPKLTRPSRK